MKDALLGFFGEALATRDPALAHSPPVFIRRAKLAVAWSPRAACSHAVLWALRHEGLLEAANAHDAWPHTYRIEVYHRRPEYKQALSRLLWGRGSGLTLLRITRNPTNRLVSIFRHACRYPFLREPARQILGFDISRRGLSLEDFDKVLGGLRLVPPSRANPHVLVQYTPLWDMAFDRVITLNLDEVPLDASLNTVERDLGLPVTDFASIAEFRRLRDEHYAIPCRYFGPGPIELRRFRRHETQPFPKHALTASPLLESMAQRHHALDWGRVATGDTAGALFQPAAGPRGPDPNSCIGA